MYTMTYRLQTAFTIVMVTLTAVLLTLIISHQLDASNSYTCHTTRAQVEGNGDTVWGVVSRNCDGNMNAAVYDTLNLEGNSTIVQPWQWIILPADP